MSQIFKDADLLTKKQLAQNYSYMGLVPKYYEQTWHDFKNDGKAKEIIQRYLNNSSNAISEGVGFYLYGENGVGKTMLLNLAFQELFHKRYTVKILQLSDIVNLWFSSDTRHELIRDISRVKFLGIEEIGKEYKAKNSEYVTSILDYIIKIRDQYKKPLWITSNIPPEDIKVKYTEDIASMLRGICVTLPVIGDDYRKKIQENLKNTFK